MAPHPLDDKDRTLLRLLERDSRTPLKALAAQVGLSSSTVHERIQRMEREGVIRRFTIDTQDAPAQAYFFVTTTAQSCARVAPRLQSISEIVRCDSVAGEIDLVLVVRAATNERLQDIRDEIASIEGVSHITTAPCLVQRF